MKKFLLAVVAVLGMSVAANAQESYNEAYVGFDNYSQKAKGADAVNMAGFELGYNHGFGVAENMAVEVGGRYQMNFKSEDGAKSTYGALSVPVNFAYFINCTDVIKVAPYAGLNAKFNLIGENKVGKVKSNWYSDGDAKRFQAGFQVGVKGYYNNILLGVEFEYDFVQIYKKCNTYNFGVAVGYRF